MKIEINFNDLERNLESVKNNKFIAKWGAILSVVALVLMKTPIGFDSSWVGFWISLGGFGCYWAVCHVKEKEILNLLDKFTYQNFNKSYKDSTAEIINMKYGSK